MGAVVGCLGAQGASCFASCAASCLGSCLGSALSGTNSARIGSLVMFGLTAICAFVLENWGKSFLGWIPDIENYCGPDSDSACFGAIGVYKFTFALVVLHLVMALVMIGTRSSKDPRVSFHNGWWLIKIGLWLCLVVAAFFIPNAFYSYFGYFSFACAVIFILVQLALLIDFAYVWNQSWLANADEDESWYYGLFGVTIVMYLCSLVGTGLMFYYFPGGLNAFFISFNLILAIIYSLASVSSYVQEANYRVGLLQSSIVTAYTTYLVSSALLSEPGAISGDSKGSEYTSLLIGGLFSLVAVCYSTLRTAGASESVDAQSAGLLSSKDEEDQTSASEETEVSSFTYSFFHLVFALGAMYICQLMTDWSILSTSNNAQQSGVVFVDMGSTAVWIKVISGWLTVGLYLWTIFAPVLMPNRSWD